MNEAGTFPTRMKTAPWIYAGLALATAHPGRRSSSLEGSLLHPTAMEQRAAIDIASRARVEILVTIVNIQIEMANCVNPRTAGSR